MFDTKAAADTALASVKKLGFTGIVVKTTESANDNVLTKGSVVRTKAGAKYYDGETPLAFVYNRDHVVRSIAGNRVVITYNGSVIGAVHKDNLILVK